MANEAFPISENSFENIKYFTVADDFNANEGTLMVFSADPRTLTPHSGANQIAVGWLVQEKVAGTAGATVKVGVRVQGDMIVISDAAITAGDILEVGATRNRLKTHVAEAFSSGNIAQLCAFSYETASGAGEEIHVAFQSIVA